VRGDRLYGRGSSDAKGQVLAHVWGVLAWLATSGSGAPPVTLRLLVEGEEETGSAHLAELLREQSDRVAADLVVVSDTMTWASDRPAICVGNRGMMKAEVEIRGAASDTHGGAVAGAAPNAADELVRVLAQLHDAGRTVTVPGFYDDVTDPGPDEAAELARLTADQADWLRRTGTGRVHGEPGRSLGELLFTRPALEVLMLAAGDAQPPTTGTMPAAARAELQVSLVPEQHPDRVAAQLESWFAAHVADGFVHRLTVADTVNQPAYLTPPDHPVLEVFARSMAEVWGLPVGRMRNAGGAPTVLLSAAAGAPVAFFGTGLPEDNWHGPDESVDLDVLIKGAATLATAWPRLAQRWAPPAS
jgi:acetylornithine deacetylase/succinyl-diaminopimelate desuccinylase-like protein